MKTLFKKYDIEDSRLERDAKIELTENGAIIDCYSFSDFNLILDIIYIEKLSNKYDIGHTFVGMNFANGVGGMFRVILTNKDSK